MRDAIDAAAGRWYALNCGCVRKRPAFRRLLAIALLFALNACEGGPPADTSEDLITAEIRAAIASGDLAALSQADLPEIPGIDAFIVDPDMAVVLGKAFFWEMSTGSNGQACASCHFHAGTDRRIQNTLHPGGKDEVFLGRDAEAVDRPLFVFEPLRGGNAGGPNSILNEHDFPFHDKADAADRDFGRDGAGDAGGTRLLPDPCRFKEPSPSTSRPNISPTWSPFCVR